MRSLAQRSQAARRAARTRARIAALTPNRPTPREARLLMFIIKFRGTCDRSPSSAEMMAFLGLRASSALGRLLAGLAAKGHIDRGPVPTAQLRMFSHSRETEAPEQAPRALGDLFETAATS
jgi:SOS-response transcriptional repressor LexA